MKQTRRRVVALAVVAGLARLLPVRAQSTSGCQFGFVNGLISIGGANCGLSTPGHMVDATGNADATSTSTDVQSPKEIRQERLQRRREHQRNQRDGLRNRRDDKQERQGDRRRERLEDAEDAAEDAAELAKQRQCSSFKNQKEAIEYMAQFRDHRSILDPDNDGMACEHLDPVTCKQLVDEETLEGISSWFSRYGFSSSNDPYKLMGKNAKGETVLCPGNG